LEAAAAAAGGRASVERTATHAVYRVVGPADEFERLAAAVLRVAAGPADAAPGALAVARVVARGQAAAESDTPEPLLRARLREALFPELDEARGAGGDLSWLTAERLRRWWAASAAAGRVAVVVAGGVEAAGVAAVCADCPVRGDRRAPMRAVAGRGDERPAPAPSASPVPQVVTRRLGLGYPASRLDPAALAVAAALLDEQLARSGLGGVAAEVWWNARRRALVLLTPERPGAAGNDEAASSRERLERAVADAAERADGAAVARARRRIVRDILFAA